MNKQTQKSESVPRKAGTAQSRLQRSFFFLSEEEVRVHAAVLASVFFFRPCRITTGENKKECL